MFETSRVDRARLQNTPKHTPKHSGAQFAKHQSLNFLGRSFATDPWCCWWFSKVDLMPWICWWQQEQPSSTWVTWGRHWGYQNGHRAFPTHPNNTSDGSDWTGTIQLEVLLVRTVCTICHKLSTTKVMVLLVLVFHATYWKVIWFVHQTVKSIHLSSRLIRQSLISVHLMVSLTLVCKDADFLLIVAAGFFPNK